MMFGYGIIVLPTLISMIIQFFFVKKDTYPKNTFLQPPSYVFGIVWSLIYLLFGVYIYLVSKNEEPFVYWIYVLAMINFIANLSWTPIVFNKKQYVIGVYIICVMISTLIGLIVATSDVLSKTLLIPYLSWLILAFILNIELARNEKNK